MHLLNTEFQIIVNDTISVKPEFITYIVEHNKTSTYRTCMYFFQSVHAIIDKTLKSIDSYKITLL